ncbi:hypothetical protein Tco_0168666 [Tanacetum coccineum]
MFEVEDKIVAARARLLMCEGNLDDFGLPKTDFLNVNVKDTSLLTCSTISYGPKLLLREKMLDLDSLPEVLLHSEDPNSPEEPFGGVELSPSGVIGIPDHRLIAAYDSPLFPVLYHSNQGVTQFVKNDMVQLEVEIEAFGVSVVAEIDSGESNWSLSVVAGLFLGTLDFFLFVPGTIFGLKSQLFSKIGLCLVRQSELTDLEFLGSPIFNHIPSSWAIVLLFAFLLGSSSIKIAYPLAIMIFSSALLLEYVTVVWWPVVVGVGLRMCGFRGVVVKEYGAGEGEGVGEGEV